MQDIVASFSSQNELVQAKRVIQQQLGPTLQLQDYIGQNFSDLPFSQNERAYLQFLSHNRLFEGKLLTVSAYFAIALVYDAIPDIKLLESADVSTIFLTNKSQLQKLSQNYPGELTAIVFPFKTSKRKAIEWIEDHWEQFSEANNELEKFKAMRIPKNLELGIEIGKLRDEGKTIDQIADFLSEKYPNDPRLTDSGHVNMIYHKYKDYVVEAFMSTIKLYMIENNL